MSSLILIWQTIYSNIRRQVDFTYKIWPRVKIQFVSNTQEMRKFLKPLKFENYGYGVYITSDVDILG